MAPTGNLSELPFRMLTRHYKAQLCYTPIFDAEKFATNEDYRKKMFTPCAKDRPLVVQFCASDPNILLKAAKLVEKDCDAVDVNLVCPSNLV